MVGIDVGDHRNDRRQEEELCIRLGGLGDQEIDLPDPRAVAGRCRAPGWWGVLP